MVSGGMWWYVVVCGGKAKVVECIYCRLKKIAIGSLAVVMPLGGPMWLGEMVIILGVVGETVGGHEIYRVYGRSIGEGRLIGYSLDVVYDVGLDVL